MSTPPQQARVIPRMLVEIFCIAVIMSLGAVCAYPSHGASNFLVPEVLSSNVYSQYIGSVLLGFGIFHTASMIWKKGYREEGAAIPVTFALTAMVMFVLYGLAFVYIGFYVSTCIFLGVLSYFLTAPDERSVRSCSIFALCTIVVIYGLFKVFKIYIPPSWLF